ncbi:phage tail protein [Pseudomonas aeruginosa]|uniref:phage tail protein n=1 Tax=Pseudomonas aeruginosa TaxID=287 RepID=UPI000F62576C|nr:phage tail protein [Pseudomonas aeruginosa]EKW6685222.1 phage tail protein [Pseudomonas aeruginosa]RRJ13865.1 phage tail protein [Pseudomonas aeruginosa]RTV55385.1 phage tail protein [Pseudomonas aeruginosa]HCT4085104.1 phage tail protein [Pseudomonas aeruginosa]HEJ2081649.1 phage tail protein [Pseudomonas aeruginosa]
MNKPNSLRAHLLEAVPELSKNPDRLLVFIDNGSIRSTVAHGLSFEYSYTLNVILTDFAGHPDAVAIPLLAWVLVNQHELLANQEKGKTAIQFEADVLDNSKVDLSIKLPLTERVIVKKQEGGALVVTHPDEPQLEPFLEAGNWQLYAEGMLLAEWQSTVQDGGDLASPHPVRHG